MQIERAYKTELDPNEGQRLLLAQHAGARRWAWNQALAVRQQYYRECGATIRAKWMNLLLTTWKRHPSKAWTYGVSNYAFQSAFADLDQAFGHFFRRCKEGAKKKGYPRFKSRHGRAGFRLYGAIQTRARAVRLPKIGWVRTHERGYLPAEGIVSATVTRRAGRWFVSLQVREEIEAEPASGPVIGIDLGLTQWVVASDGRTWERPRAFAHFERKLRGLQRQLSRRVGSRKGERKSGRWQRTKRRIEKLWYEVGCLRRNAIHEMTSELIGVGLPAEQRPRLVVVEGLRIQNMMQNGKLAREIADACWGELRRQLEYKALWYGSELLVMDAFEPTTQRCSGCGAMRKMELSERVYRCEECGLMMDRDLNSARNAEQAGLQYLAGKPPGGETAVEGEALAGAEAPVKPQPEEAASRDGIGSGYREVAAPAHG